MARRARDRERPIPARPYRDTVIVYGVLAAILVLVASLTGGDAVRAVLVASAFFVVATAWSWWRFRERIRRAEEAKAAVAQQQPGAGRSSRTNGNGNGRGGPR